MELKSVLMLFVSMVWITGLSRIASTADPVSCRLWSEPRVPSLSMNGDFNIGGIFSVHFYASSAQGTYTKQPLQLQCSGRSVCECGVNLWRNYNDQIVTLFLSCAVLSVSVTWCGMKNLKFNLNTCTSYFPKQYEFKGAALCSCHGVHHPGDQQQNRSPAGNHAGLPDIRLVRCSTDGDQNCISVCYRHGATIPCY